MELSRQDVNMIIKRLPLSDSLSALDFMARTLWDGSEYDINEWGYWAKTWQKTRKKNLKKNPFWSRKKNLSVCALMFQKGWELRQRYIRRKYNG
jgi:hypothetical protein